MLLGAVLSLWSLLGIVLAVRSVRVWRRGRR